MNTVLVLVLFLLIIFALKEGQIWIAMGVGLMMVVMATSDSSGTGAKKRGNFMYPSPDLGPVSEGMKEQMLRVKYQPKWDGNNWWEEIADHWGTSTGRLIGLMR